MLQLPKPENKPLASLQQSFPTVALVELTNYNLIKASGAQALTYLQSQLTNDLSALSETTVQWQGHCTAKGKTLSLFPMFYCEEALYYLQPKSITEGQLNALKKYSVFSKVDFEICPQPPLLIMGIQAKHYCRAIINKIEQTPISEHEMDLHYHGSYFSLIPLADDCWLFVVKPNLDLMNNTKLTAILTECLPLFDGALYPESLWTLYQINNGLPFIEPAISEQYLPHVFNLSHIDAISFTKGCYMGQEAVARAKYRGGNHNKSICFISGYSDVLLQVGDPLYCAMGGHARPIGTLLCVYIYQNNEAVALALLSHELMNEVKDKEQSIYAQETLITPWVIKPLSYVL